MEVSGSGGGSLADHERKGKPEQQLHLLSDHLHCQLSLDDDTNHDHTSAVLFVAGKVKQFVFVWQTITSDYVILGAVKGVKIEFAPYPKQTIFPRE